MNKKRKITKMIKIVALVLGILMVSLCVVTFVRFSIDIKNAKQRLASHNTHTIQTSFGDVTFIDQGEGYPIIFSHGTFGGYDQGLASLSALLPDSEGFRFIVPSRFGYPGSDLPEEATPENQAQVYLEILDALGIDQAIVVTSSAGGAAGLKLALNFPERVSGIVFVSSGVPTAYRPIEEITEPMGPPSFLVNDFMIWLSANHFGFVFEQMFNSDLPDNLADTMLPVLPRRDGILNDEQVTNIDMDIHFHDYPVEQLDMPMLIFHAKDDPMAKYEAVINFIERVELQTQIYDTGGHLLSGHDDVPEIFTTFVRQIASQQTS